MKILIFIFCVISVTFAANYCDKEKYCKFFNGREYELRDHIACPGVAKNICPKGSKAIPINALKSIILDRHNKYRNDIAGGKTSGYSPASGMTEMTWDDELAEIAAKNAMTCNYKHDACRNTDKYPRAGQNLARKWMSGYSTDDKEFVEESIDLWWNEYNDTDQDVIDSFRDTGAKIGHFTVMAHEGAYKIGCAISQYPESRVISGKYWDGVTRYLVCNYAMTNIINKPIYKKGSPRSACKAGKSIRYSNLCSSAY
ncbi:antigen 5 like allergen Cul n 1-like [Culicoides brevitarsis]|uniref:antigen 5 like allergen Cul n 1-like n=1 Tax=Culicoides brevitarsis TaxID=469753 RepID=UPI00307B6571